MNFINGLKKTLPCPWLDLALEGRKDNLSQLKAISSYLSANYLGYNSLINNFKNNLAPSTFQANKDLLKDYYLKSPVDLNREILVRRNDHGLSFCPFCGNPKKPDTLDHFIPKDSWPEFSIFPNNLVPQCRGCAPIKGENYFCHTSTMVKFIHPLYFDFINHYRYKINVAFDRATSKASFTLSLKKIHPTTTEHDNRVKLHFKNLKIRSRVEKYCQEEFRRWSARISKQRFNILEAFNQKIAELPSDEVGKDWESAFCYAMRSNTGIIEYLNSLRPANHVVTEVIEVGNLELD